eukprot:TRINITY_DN14382_c0_g1_i1.p1 TRINITY_DN14382_c0_g1~~TRINITY_DN14382_c0_g1_i1.p1  ORF type:complete len:113 (-),score=10.81 TRINITY_DN14382_c0_g1_i1:34-372(-)
MLMDATSSRWHGYHFSISSPEASRLGVVQGGGYGAERHERYYSAIRAQVWTFGKRSGWTPAIWTTMLSQVLELDAVCVVAFLLVSRGDEITTSLGGMMISGTPAGGNDRTKW